jgi:hypothetical protein
MVLAEYLTILWSSGVITLCSRDQWITYTYVVVENDDPPSGNKKRMTPEFTTNVI